MAANRPEDLLFKDSGFLGRVGSLSHGKGENALAFGQQDDPDQRVRILDGFAIQASWVHASYLHEHSGISRASSRHSGGTGRLRESDVDLIPDTVLPVYPWLNARLLKGARDIRGREIPFGRPRGPLLPGSRLQTHGPAGPSGRKAVSGR